MKIPVSSYAKLFYIGTILSINVLACGQELLYLDPHQPVDKRVEDLLSRMTLEEKLGQLNAPVPGNMAKDIPAQIDACLKFARGNW